MTHYPSHQKGVGWKWVVWDGQPNSLTNIPNDYWLVLEVIAAEAPIALLNNIKKQLDYYNITILSTDHHKFPNKSTTQAWSNLPWEKKKTLLQTRSERVDLTCKSMYVHLSGNKVQTCSRVNAMFLPTFCLETDAPGRCFNSHIFLREFSYFIPNFWNSFRIPSSYNTTRVLPPMAHGLRESGVNTTSSVHVQTSGWNTGRKYRQCRYWPRVRNIV